MVDSGVRGGVAAARDAVDVLLAAPLAAVPAADLIEVFRELEVQRRRLAAVDQRLIAALGSSGAVAEAGATSLPDLVAGSACCSRGEARARVSRSVDLGPRRTVSGEPLEPIHAVLAAAVADGAVSEPQSDVIIDACGRIGPDAEPWVFEVVQRFLVRAARVEPPAALARSAAWVLAQLDPAGLEPAERTTERSRSFCLAERAGADGCVAAKGRLTPETAAVLRSVLDALAAPRPVNAAGQRDERDAGQRRHDALLEMALRLLRSGELPDCGGVAASVLIELSGLADLSEAAPTNSSAQGATTSEPDDVGAGEAGRLLARMSGLGRLRDGGPIRLERLRPLLDECEITTVVLTASGGVLDYGRERRVATPAMRRALAARDGGCCFPGCDRPPAWCEAHHVWAWIDGGPTCLGNLCLLCAHHHRAFGPAGWQVQMRDGIPVWIPPPWLDPRRQILTNTVRHLPRVDFGAVSEHLLQPVAEVLRT